MSTEYSIEVCIEPDVTQTARGELLENFAGRFLRTQGYDITSRVRLTGMEVDVLCKHKMTGEIILVECKAYRSNVAAEVITKLLGSVQIGDYAAGWLISTHALGKDAKGLQVQWSERTPEQRRQLTILPPDKLVDLLVGSRLLADPKTLIIPRDALRRGNEIYLLINERGEYWAIPTIDEATGLTATLFVFNADTGKIVNDKSLVSWIKGTDTTLSNLDWNIEPEKIPVATKLRDELQSVVTVPMAEHWADYRPSRPTDFVGRESTQKSIFDFFEAVRERTTTTRLVALKSPSGWGKSSTVLKIADRAKYKRNRSRYFVYPVDSRAALTERFPELAVVKAIDAAARSGFIPRSPDLSFGSAGAFFSTDSMKALARNLSEDKKVVCVFFDQFEELLYKEELSHVFDEMRRLCSSIEEAQENFVIGFSWKTDGTITTEHAAYYLWHDLADRRMEIDLPSFSGREVALAINRFGKELGEPVASPLRRLLEDHCRGFPWLLKKLCIHVIELVRGGSDQADILSKNLNIISLFKKDLENLNSEELSCLRQVAEDSPAAYFSIDQKFGDQVVTQLLNKRLIIRSGTRLTIYWDIFKDYILSERIPYIPITYIPQVNFNLYIRALRFLSSAVTTTYRELGEAMNLTGTSTDNLVRDLVNLGHVEAWRREGRLSPLFNSPEEAAVVSFNFWKSHDIVRKLLFDYGTTTEFSDDDFHRMFYVHHERSGFAPKTLTVYSKRTLRWLESVGLLRRELTGLAMMDPTQPLERTLDHFVYPSVRRRIGVFLADAPPERVVAAYRQLPVGSARRSELERTHGRNTIGTLLSLGLIAIEADTIEIPEKTPSGTVDDVRAAALKTSTIQIAVRHLKTDPWLRGTILGGRIAEELGLAWAPASCSRNGAAIKKWALWVDDTLSNETNDLFKQLASDA